MEIVNHNCDWTDNILLCYHNICKCLSTNTISREEQKKLSFSSSKSFEREIGEEEFHPLNGDIHFKFLQNQAPLLFK